MKKQDVLFGIITGLMTGAIAWGIFTSLDKTLPSGIPLAILIVLVPVLWVAGVWLGYFLGRWMPFFVQFGKYAAIGFTNFAVDSGVIYLLGALTGFYSGIQYSAFKIVSFLVAVTNSYFWNKFWAFNAVRGGGGSEAVRFLSINVVALLVNVSIASLVVNGIGPTGGITEKAWAGIGSVAGSATALIFSFVGFRLVVFKTKNVPPSGMSGTP